MGVFRVKNHDFMQKNHIFPNTPPLDPRLVLKFENYQWIFQNDSDRGTSVRTDLKRHDQEKTRDKSQTQSMGTNDRSSVDHLNYLGMG